MSSSSITPHSLPRLAAHVRLKQDTVRGRWVVLAPERMLIPDDVAVEVLRLCTGGLTVAAMVEHLAKDFQADPAEVQSDVLDLLNDLQTRGFVTS